MRKEKKREKEKKRAYLHKEFQRNEIEIVHAQQSIDALYAKLACIGTGIKVILTFHGYDYIENTLGRIVLKYIISRTDRNLFVSKNQCQYYQDKYKLDPNYQEVVYNGISFDKLEQKTNSNSKTANIRKELKLDDCTLLLGMVGNFNQVRDQMTICRFIDLLNAEGVNFKFIFIGKKVEGCENLYNDCIQYIHDKDLDSKVHFLGVRNDVPEILPYLDAFIYSTNHDTFGIAVVEAMALGLPVFVNDWEVMCEITDNGIHANLYKTKDENDLLQHFLLFLQNKEEYIARAKDAIIYVNQKFSIEKHINNLKTLYGSL